MTSALPTWLSTSKGATFRMSVWQFNEGVVVGGWCLNLRFRRKYVSKLKHFPKYEDVQGEIVMKIFETTTLKEKKQRLHQWQLGAS